MTGEDRPERVQEGRAEVGQGEGSGEGAVKAPPRRYGAWAGNPKGSPEDPTRCRAEVWPRCRGFISAQCSRKRGHGEDGAFCSIHAKPTTDIKPLRPEPSRRK